MRMSNVKISKLKNIKDFSDLIEYLRDELDWPIEVEDAEDITFDYYPKELGIEGKYAAKINIIKQIRPLVDNQPWGLFYIEFESKRLPVVVLRRILRALIHSRRSTSDRMKTWDLTDLIFISTLGEEVERKISFAHFSKSEEGLPVLRTFSWDPTDTYFHYLQTKLDLEKLSWPNDESDVDSWLIKWSSAFKLKHREVIRTSKQLATLMAQLAMEIREQVKHVYKFEIKNGPLHKLLNNFKKTLIHDLKIDNFADMYAQTIAYGLFSARTSHEGEFKIDNISAMIPNTNPFLRNLFEECTKIGEDNINKIDLDELGVRELILLLKESNIEAVLQDFGKQKKGEDPVIHFYELFLNEYDSAQKIKRGVFYTPDSVVSFIVRSVNNIIQNEFGYTDGLMDINKTSKNDKYKILILDPAAGTGTFLQHVIREIKKQFDNKYKGLDKKELKKSWNEFVPNHLFPKLFGFEIMMAPYAVAHLKIGLTLRETGYDFQSNKRLGVYLTNTLEGTHKSAGTLDVHLNWLAAEVDKANEVKTGGISIIIGNPPYSVSSQNKGDYIEKLMKDYKDTVSKEKNIQPLSDDYVKFIRYCHHLMERKNFGILAFITNNSYLSGIIHRGMREKLLKTFDKIYVLNLHGNVRIGEKCPDGSKDENVFDIMQGVAISIFVKKGNSSESTKVLYKDLYGLRENKYEFLNKNDIQTIKWDEINYSEPYFFFVQKDFSFEPEYSNYISISKIFYEFSGGVKTHRDHFVVGFTKDEILKKIKKFTSKLPAETIKEDLKLKDTRDWKFDDVKNEIKDFNWDKYIRKYSYRPFDDRLICYLPVLLERGCHRWDLMRNFFNNNIGLVTTRLLNRAAKEFLHSFVNVNVIDIGFLSSKTSETTYIFPLKIYSGIKRKDPSSFEQERENSKLNINLKIFNNLSKHNIKPYDLFCYIYGILNSNSYRSRYFEFLKIDYPKIPDTENIGFFEKIRTLGSKLIKLHLLKSDLEDGYNFNFHEEGDIILSKPKYNANDERIYINETQYFQNVTKEIWEYRIGGYPVCNKWLKGYKGRELSKAEIKHFERVLLSINETMKIAKDIDKVIEAYGGWPIK